MNYKEIDKCRSCGNEHLVDILEMGDQALVGFEEKKTEPVHVPLTLCLCPECHLTQLKHTTNPNLLYNENYGYRSGINEQMRYELRDVAVKAEEYAGLKDGDSVVDIGSNDGTLLSLYRPAVQRIGFDPSRNMIPYFVKTMTEHNLPVSQYRLYPDYFAPEPLFHEKPNFEAKVVTAISMFYDLDDPNAFVKGVKRIMAKDSVFVVQQNYLLGMLKQLAFDNICHEHLEYYSLASLTELLKRHGMEVFDVEEREINGGSFRTYIRNVESKVGGEINPSVEKMRQNEEAMGLLATSVYCKFAERVEDNGSRLKEFLTEEVAAGKTVYVYGASTRGNSLLQHYGIDNTLITAAAERNKDKVGKIYGSTGIPIVSEEEARAVNPDYFLCLPWFFKDNFIEREQDYLDKGGALIFPLPKLEVVKK